MSNRRVSIYESIFSIAQPLRQRDPNFSRHAGLSDTEHTIMVTILDKSIDDIYQLSSIFNSQEDYILKCVKDIKVKLARYHADVIGGTRMQPRLETKPRNPREQYVQELLRLSPDELRQVLLASTPSTVKSLHTQMVSLRENNHIASRW